MKPSLGEKPADKVTSTMGTWGSILIQLFVIIVWAITNTTMPEDRLYPNPCSFLNLTSSAQSSLIGPIYLISEVNHQEKVYQIGHKHLGGI